MTPDRIRLSDLPAALRTGIAYYTAALPLAALPCLPLAGIAALAFWLLERQGWTPLYAALLGGFMLFAPLPVALYGAVAGQLAQGKPPRVAALPGVLRTAPGGFWGLVLFCLLMFLIWETDAATLYGFMIGQQPMPLNDTLAALRAGEPALWRYVLWSSCMGGVIAGMVFVVTCFAMPLLLARRCGAVQAVLGSVRAVFRSPGPMLLWALLLGVLIQCSLLLLPLFLIAFPVLAYASHALYRRTFPEEGTAPQETSP